jgi:histidinol dehydrogenase
MWKQVDMEQWSVRRKGKLSQVRAPVEEIISKVRDDGDKALFELTERFDKVKLDHLRVSKAEIELAYHQVDPSLVQHLIKARDNIARFHQMQRRPDLWLKEVQPGVTLGVKTTPLDRIGAYIPGGRAAYPSTVLMCAVPARVAGVRSIVCCTPPPINPLTLVAMDIAGVDEVYSVGGAHAVAAMALGTRTIAPVQKIVGPGNVFVTAAKMLLREEVEIDFPAGPSEIIVLADSSAEPGFIAADILAQAEHDPNATCLLITTDQALASKVGRELEQMAAKTERKEIADIALVNAGYILVKDVESGVEIVNHLAPEHLSIVVTDQLMALSKVKNAGSIFVGKYAPVACGDYASGTNHVLPTAGYASMSSGLDVEHFLKRSSVQIIDQEGLEALSGPVEALAKAEGLFAHANSIAIRRDRSP